MIEDMTVRNLSPETQDAYVRAAAKLGKHFHCSPDLLGPEDISACQVHLPARCLL
jgi:integrase/recombinase XerD